MKTTGKRRLYRQLVAASLIMGGAFNLAAPVLAQTAAGTSISNTATGSYDDGTPGAPTINTTSNTVTITVAEVAGIDVSASNDPGSAVPGGTLNYEFIVKNTGNDATKFVLPSTATLTGAGSTGASAVVIYDVNGNGQFEGGETIATPTTTASIPVGGTVKVRVVVTVATTAQPGQTITVEYGKSLTPASTNQDYVADGNNDVKTQDPTDATTDDPVNGIREDSATLNATVSGAAVILNGPNNQPDATGPVISGQTDTNNTDFTNKNTGVPPGIAPGTTTLPDGTTYNPAVVEFTNTIKNGGTASGDFKVQPTTAVGILESGGKLPSGTTVKIIDAADTTKTATYTWNGSTFTLSAGTPVVITVAAGATVNTANYKVEVDLPAGTKLSTDLTGNIDTGTAQGGYAVPIVAYIDAGTPNNTVDAGEIKNLTTNRTYAGYMAMYKEARILNGTTQVAPPGDGNFTTDGSLLTSSSRPGNTIEYRIRYKNISEPTSGSGNVILNANKFKITENGAAGGNTWFGVTLDPSYPTTSTGSASASKGTVTVTTATPTGATAADIQTYVNDVSDNGTVVLAPTETGNFIFQRKIK